MQRLCVQFLAAMAVTLASLAAAQDDQIVYDDALQNGWVSYGWATLDFSATAFVHGGAKSISVTDPTSNYQALYLHHDAFDNSAYQSLSFWINGGASGGQNLRVQGVLNGVSQTAVVLSILPANAWQQVTLSLSDLGVANNSTFDGFWIQNNSGAPAPTFYVDDISLIAAPPPAQIQISINAASVIRTIDERIFGINLAIWDSLLSGPDNDALLSAMGTRTVRFPGGSLSDDYDWQTDRSVSDGGPFQWPNNAATFARVAETRGVQPYVTVNYGSGTPEQAAAWVAYYNGDPASAAVLGTDAKGRDWKTVGYWAAMRAAGPLAVDDGFNFLRAAHPAPYGFRYWEVGNENYGSWEYDQHGMAGSGLSGAPHDAATYAAWFKLFYNQMLAVDPTIRVGAVFDPAFVTKLNAAGVTPHYVIYHRYPQNAGNENDATLLQGASGVLSDAATVRNAITNTYGAANGAAIELAMTELNSTSSGVGKQSVSLVNALFMADSVGYVARSEFNSCLWWDLRNGSMSGNNAASLYGWRQFGDYGVLAAGDRNDTPANTPYPTFYAAKLLTHWGRGGDQVVAADSNYPLLSVHAARLANGNLALLAINRSASTDANTQIAVAGFTPDPGATVYRYGKQNDLANADLSANSINGASTAFAYSFPSYSMSVIVLRAQGAPPLPPPPVISSALTATPNPAQVGATVSFAAAASGNNLTYAWTFGDGTGASGATPTHVYTTAGIFTAIVTVSDGSGGTASGSVDVMVDAPSLPLTLTKFSAKLNFARSNRDTISLSGILPLTAGMTMSGQTVTVNMSGIVKQFTFDSRGRMPRGNDIFKLSFKKHRGRVLAQNAPFSATFSRGNFAAALNAAGLTNATASNVEVTIPVTIMFNGNTYSKLQSKLYSAKAGVRGMTH